MSFLSNYYLKRFFLAVPTLLGVTLITFFLLRALPGDPVHGMVGERADPELIEQIRENLGAEKPLFVQYTGYLCLVIKGEFGRSYYTNRKVLDDITEKLPNTIKLAFAAMLFSTFFGLVLGVLMAVYRDGFWDRVGQIISVAGISVPVFWLGLLLIYFFSFYLKILPPSGMGGGSILFLIMPASTLGLNSAAYLARVTRSSMIEVLSQPYIITAKAKGLKRRAVIFKHALKNAFIPVITLIGLDFGSYLNGSVLTETIFGWDGIGRYAVEGIFRRDYPVIMGCILVGAALFVLINLLVDIIYGFIDPRIRHRGKN